MKTTIKQNVILGLLCGLAAVTGCVSPQEKARQQEAAQIQLQEQKEAQQEASQRLANKQNWSKLREGLTVEEVDQLVGPIGAERKKMYTDSLQMGEMFSTLQNGPIKSDSDATFEMEVGVLMFHNGKLKSWQLRQ